MSWVALLRKHNPRQPRDERGRFASTDGAAGGFGDVPHTRPYPGDGGLRYEPAPGYVLDGKAE